RRAAHVQKVGHILAGFAFVDQLPGVGNLLGGKFYFPTKFHAPALRCLHSGPRAFGDQRPFEFSQNADHLPHGAARRRRGVDGSWVSLYGTILASTTTLWNNDFPTSLGGTTVTITQLCHESRPFAYSA